MYWVTYVPVVVNMTASSPEEQMLDKPELAFQQSDFDLEPVSTTVENSSVSPVIVEHLAPAETPADEIEAQEAEPPKNEPEPGSEDESNDGVLSPVEEPNNTTMHKPEMENKRIQYSRDFLLSIQFMPECMQKPEGLPSIPDVVLHKELFRMVRGFLNKLTAEMFNQLIKQVKELHIDREERLKGVVNLIFEKAIVEPNFSMGYRVMCKSLAA
ncbi:eukaryotic translation initiation factor 4 gamma 3 isoform X2, partial [Silurus meridionalis]